MDLADKEALKATVGEADIVVDATRVGMGDLADQSNLEQEWMRPGQMIVDTTSIPVITELLRRAEAAGATPITGLTMLVAQGALGEKIWFGVDMPIDDVKRDVFKDLK